jgi:hypothetical protein
MLKNIAAVDHKLMLALGYDKYIAQGGDWGSKEHEFPLTNIFGAFSYLLDMSSESKTYQTMF